MITVKVFGFVGTGKTCIAKLISDALVEKGFKDVTVCDDQDYTPNQVLNFDKIVERVSKQTIVIETVQGQRMSIHDRVENRPILPR